MISGGPCRYAGPDMRAVHAGRHIGDAEFDAFVADLVAALEHFNVPAGEKAELLALLAPMRRDIVGA
jgi:hemoglobin